MTFGGSLEFVISLVSLGCEVTNMLGCAGLYWAEVNAINLLGGGFLALSSLS